MMSIRDTYMPARVTALMHGPPSSRERALPGLASVLVRQQPDIKDVRRFTILRFLVALADTHHQVCPRAAARPPAPSGPCAARLAGQQQSRAWLSNMHGTPTTCNLHMTHRSRTLCCE